MTLSAERQRTLAETARLLLCLTLSAIGFYVIALLCAHFYHPDIQLLIEESKALLPDYLICDVHPEPLENLLYNIGLLYFPLSLLGLYALFSEQRSTRLFSQPGIATTIIYILCLGLLILGFITLRQPNPFMGAKFSSSDFQPNNFKVFFAPLLAAGKPLVYLVIIPAVLGLFYGLSRLKPTACKWTDLLLGCLVNGIAIWLISIIYRINTYAFPETWQGQFDFNAVYYSQTQTMAGSPVLINGTTNTYGGYPLFLTPIFKSIGLDISHFTRVMSLIIVACILCWTVFLNRFTRSRLIAALGLVSLLFFGYLSPYLHDFLIQANTFDSYFANTSIRWVSPALTLLLATLYCSRYKALSRASYYAAALLLPLGIIWCPDFGSVCTMAWLLFLLYRDFWVKTDTRKPRVDWKTELRHLAVWAAGIVISLGMFALILYIAYHAWPDYRLLFRTATVFGKIGFFTLPMQAVHPWILVVLALGLGLAVSLSAFYRRQIDDRRSVIFLLSILGCAFFVYFKSRSYHANLTPSALYAGMALILWTDMMWWKIREKRIAALWPPTAIGLILISFSVPESLAAAPNLHTLTKPYHGAAIPQEKGRILANKNFIRNYTAKTDKVWVLTSHKYQSLYFDKPLLQSAFNPSFLDMNMRADHERAFLTLRDSNFTVFLDGTSFYYSQFCNLRDMLAARYVIDSQYVQQEKTFFSALNPRHTDRLIPVQPCLQRSGEAPVFYRKYQDSPDSYAVRVQDAEGTPLPITQSTFSLEMVFLTGPQHYSRSALFSQISDTINFGMYHINEDGRTDLFGLVLGKSQCAFHLPTPAWCYMVIHFTPEYMDIFVNTRPYGRIRLDAPYPPHTENLYIGAVANNLGHYFGAISEIAIYNRLKTESEILATFKQCLDNFHLEAE